MNNISNPGNLQASDLMHIDYGTSYAVCRSSDVGQNALNPAVQGAGHAPAKPSIIHADQSRRFLATGLSGEVGMPRL